MTFPTLSACNLLHPENKEQNYVIHNLKDLVGENYYIPEQPHRHSFYQIIYIQKGSGVHRVDFRELKITNDIIFFLSPGQVHNLLFTEIKPEGLLINFKENFFNTFLSQHNFIEKLPLFNKNGKRCYLKIKKYQQDIKDAFQKIKTIRLNNIKYSEDLIKLYILQILLLVSSEIKKSELNDISSVQSNLVKNFEDIIEVNYRKEHYPKFYANSLAITPNYLNSVCKTETGKTAGEIIRNRLILEAKRLLANSQMNISQISYDLCFEDNSYFTKFFKAGTGISPYEFKKTLK